MLQKSLFSFGLLSTLIFSSLYAYDRSISPAGKMSDDQIDHTITPNAGPRVAAGADIFITASFLWWTAHEDGLGYVGSGARNGSVVSASRSRLECSEFP